jgi:UDP-N-acetylglucosamine 2-epimerase (non-hydrolysing)
MNTKLKIVTIVGTRPELIRLSVLIPLLDRFFNHILVHTGQNYDFELNQIFFDELSIRKPNHFLNCSTDSLGSTIADIIVKSEAILKQENPDALLILGDTNSSLSAIIAKRLKIPIYHMEAGNRSFDLNVPEEINRKLVDHISDFNLVYSEHARRNLLNEGIHPRFIIYTGSPLREVINTYSGRISESKILNKLSLSPKKYFLISTHREENVDNKANLQEMIDSFNGLVEKYNLPLIISTHPRTRKRLEALGVREMDSKIQFMKPFGFYDYIKLQQNALCILSDSGSVSEEAAILGVPAVTIRNSMERPEAMDTGSIMITGINKETILQSVETTIQLSENCFVPNDYKIENTSRIVLKLIIGTAKLVHNWQGVNQNRA